MDELESKPLKYQFIRLINEGIKERKKKGLSRYQFAELKGISRSSVYKVENFDCYDLKIIDKYIK